MIVLWFVLGILIAFGIARYNESNKLFWQLLLAFILGYSVTVMCTRTFGDDKKSDTNAMQVSPTQVHSVVLGNVKYLLEKAIDMQPMEVTAPTLVSQVYIPARIKNVTRSEVFGRTRDQPLEALTKPPELCLTKGSLTHHDG